jgi:hypothetical protein
MVIYHIAIVILDIDMGYGLMIWEMTVSIRSSPQSVWDILSLLRRWRESSGAHNPSDGQLSLLAPQYTNVHT